MNADLEAQLREMGGEYRAVVARLSSAYCPAERETSHQVRFIRRFGSSAGYLVAASLLAVLGFGAFRLFNSSPSHSTIRRFEHSEISSTEYALASLHTDAAVREMIRTQNADGSWKNDFLTRQNAAALRLCDSAAARIAYKKAMRNLRVRGLL